MSFRTRRVLFITPFYMLFQFFLLKYIFMLIGDVSDVCLLVMTVFLGMIHCLPMFFEAKRSTVPGRIISEADGIWMWASVMFLIDIVFIYVICVFAPLPQFLIYALLAVVPVLGVYNYYNAHKLVINEKVLRLDNLARDINIVHMSDVHFGSVRHREIIHQISSALKDLEDECELAVISGDLADGSSAVGENDFMELKNVKMPIIFTPGNHDFYPGIDNVVRACENAGIIVLDNDCFEHDCLNIYGLRFSFHERNTPEIDETLIKSGYVNILNYHVPYYWDQFSAMGFDIQLSGHTHGGQFYPAVNFAQWMFKYNMGLFKNDSGRYLHVTTGVGSMDTPMRWGTSSEMVILRLKKI